MRSFAVIVAFSGCLFTSACDTAEPPICTQIGCSSGYLLSVHSAENRFPAGRYDIRLTPEADSTHACFFVVTDDATQCDSGECITQENCNALYLVGSADPDRVELGYPVVAGPLRVIVERDGVVIRETVFQPAYEESQPNGPGCAPTCLNASNDLMIE